MDFFEALQEDRTKQDAVKAISSIPSNYVGSKRRLLLHIWDTLEENGIEFDSAFDAFSGSAMVSLMFKHMGKKVIANDLLTSSAITAICLLENSKVALSSAEVQKLIEHEPDDVGTFVLDNYKDKFFTEKECKFLDRYRRNIELFYGDKLYCGIDLLNKATLASITNSNFTVYGKDLKKIRSTHEVGKSFWTEKWRDTTRKRRDVNNEIMFGPAIEEMYMKYKSAYSLFAIENHVNQNCFLGGRYYNGQTIAQLDHRLAHQKNNGTEINDIDVSLKKVDKALIEGESLVFNSDIIDLLSSGIVSADLIYIDPPYGGSSSDYATLYRFLEEFLYEDKLENLEHIQKGAKRFTKAKGYREQFEELLSHCDKFPVWLISYNESSWADLDTILDVIRNAGRSNIVVNKVPITYQYRKGKNEIDVEHFEENYLDDGHKYVQRGTEYLILAT